MGTFAVGALLTDISFSHARKKKWTHLCQNNPVPEQPPDVSMPALDFQETPDDNADDSGHEERAPTEPVPQSSSSHWEWRPEYDVPPPEPGDPGMTRRRIVAKRPPTDDEEEEMRQKRLRSESVPELFPLTGEELSEDVFEILVDPFASPESNCCENSHELAGSEFCDDSRVPEAHVYTQDRDRARPLKRRVKVSMRNLTREERCIHASKTEGMGFVAGQRSCGTGQGSVESTSKPYPSCPLGADVEKRWDKEISKSSIVCTWFSGSSLDNTSHFIYDSDVRW